MRLTLVVLAIVMVLTGLAWLGQGLGFIAGSFMSGDETWAIIGSIVAGVGLGLLVREWRLRRSGPA